VIVIDNNSQDNTVAIIRDQFPQVIVHQAGFNLGFGQGNNLGFKMGLDWEADFFFLLNQDAWVEGNCLLDLCNISLRNPEYGVLSPMHWNRNKTDLDHGFKLHVSRNGELARIIGGESKDVHSVSFVNAAAWLVSKACLLKVGGFAPLFYHYGEDDDYVNRASYYGFKVGVCPLSTIIHDREILDKKNTFAHQYRMYLINATNINTQWSLFDYLKSWSSLFVKDLSRLRLSTLFNYPRLAYRAIVDRNLVLAHRRLASSGRCYLIL
jgi:GT2 family glycosyltransferase